MADSLGQRSRVAVICTDDHRHHSLITGRECRLGGLDDEPCVVDGPGNSGDQRPLRERRDLLPARSALNGLLGRKRTKRLKRSSTFCRNTDRACLLDGRLFGIGKLGERQNLLTRGGNAWRLQDGTVEQPVRHRRGEMDHQGCAACAFAFRRRSSPTWGHRRRQQCCAEPIAAPPAGPYELLPCKPLSGSGGSFLALRPGPVPDPRD